MAMVKIKNTTRTLVTANVSGFDEDSGKMVDPKFVSFPPCTVELTDDEDNSLGFGKGVNQIPKEIWEGKKKGEGLKDDDRIKRRIEKGDLVVLN